MPVDISNEDIVHVVGEKTSASERPLVIPANNSAFVSKDALHYIAKKRKKSFLTSWTKSRTTRVCIYVF